MANELFLKGHKQLKRKITYGQYSRILRDVFIYMMHEMIINSTMFKLPMGMGNMSIIQNQYEFKLDENGKIKKPKSIIDYGESRKLWAIKYKDIPPKDWNKIRDKPLILYENKHTGGKMYKFKWFKNRKKMLWIYKFESTRGGMIDDKYNGNRGLSAYVKTEFFNNEYYDIDIHNGDRKLRYNRNNNRKSSEEVRD